MAEKKTPTGLNELPSQNSGSIDIMAELNKMLSTPSPTVDSFDAPTPSALPDTPPQLEKGMSTKIGRAIAVAMVGMNNPEQGMAMIKQFQAEDESAKNEVQQRFANEMAIAQAQQQRIAFTQDVKQAQRDDAQEDASLRIRVIEAALKKLDMENSPGGSNPKPNYPVLRQLMLDTLGAAQEQQGIDEAGSINEGLDCLQGQIMGALSAGLPDADVMALSSGSQEDKERVIKEIKAFRKRTLAPSKIKETPELEQFRRSIETVAMMNPNDPEPRAMLASYHGIVSNMPDPTINDPGDLAAMSQYAAEMLALNPGAFQEVGDAVASKILADNMASSMGEAEELAAELLAEAITTDDLRADPTIKREPGRIEQLFKSTGSTVLEQEQKASFLSPEQAKERTRLRRKVNKTKADNERLKVLNELAGDKPTVKGVLQSMGKGIRETMQQGDLKATRRF